MKNVQRYFHKRRGFSLMEVLILVVVLGIVAAAAGRALQAMARTPVAADETLQIETQVISKIEELRALPLTSLVAGTTTSTVSIGDASVGGQVKYFQMTITISNADADGDGIAEIDPLTLLPSYKQISVTCGGQTMTTTVSK
jgi:prepilin-type N-terminal cleavage/methylation domain-containing protein